MSRRFVAMAHLFTVLYPAMKLSCNKAYSLLILTLTDLPPPPQLSANSHHILKDNRFVDLETNGQLHIDIVKQSIRERVLKFLVDNSKPYMLDGVSAYKFTQWVANRSSFTETMQS